MAGMQKWHCMSVISSICQHPNPCHGGMGTNGEQTMSDKLDVTKVKARAFTSSKQIETIAKQWKNSGHKAKLDAHAVMCGSALLYRDHGNYDALPALVDAIKVKWTAGAAKAAIEWLCSATGLGYEANNAKPLEGRFVHTKGSDEDRKKRFNAEILRHAFFDDIQEKAVPFDFDKALKVFLAKVAAEGRTVQDVIDAASAKWQEVEGEVKAKLAKASTKAAKEVKETNAT